MLRTGIMFIIKFRLGMKPYTPRDSYKQPKLNHAVLLVGYTPKYWIIQNSWGKYSFLPKNILYNNFLD